jgi:hypothetical protein
MAETADLWAGYRRYATSTLPSVEKIATACEHAERRFREEAERTPGHYVDPDLAISGTAVRRLQCSWEKEKAVTARCRFETTPIYWSENMAPGDPLPERKGKEWRKMTAQVIRVRGPIAWIAPKGCRPPSA